MAKSANDITFLLNVSDLNNSALVDVIGDYFEDCSSLDAEAVGSISVDLLEVEN